MNVRTYLTLSVVTLAAYTVPAANADSYTETRIEESPAPMSEVREEVRTEEAPSTTVIREQPTIIEEHPVQKEKVVVKKHGGHLIQVGPVKAF